MSTPVGSLPAAIPTVVVTGTYRGPDGRGLAGTVTFTGPGLLTFAVSDLFVAGPVVARLDETGSFSVRLPATDAPDMNPSGWSYTVKENLTGVTGSRTFGMVLPKGTGPINLADVAPADPTTPNYVAVPGPQGPKGDRGSYARSGTAIPAAALGDDGDIYTRYEVTTFLGVTSTTVTVYVKEGGTWVQVGGLIRGAVWYFNNTGTPSADTKPGDMLYRTDTGDVWQRGASGWGNVVGNLKGPKGDPGPKGDSGGDTLVMDWTPLASLGTFAAMASASTPPPRMRKLRNLGTEIWEFEGAIALTSAFTAGTTHSVFTPNAAHRPAATRGTRLYSTQQAGVRAGISTTLTLGIPSTEPPPSKVWLDGWRITNPAAV